MTVTVVRPAPYSTVQDLGRKRHRAFGVPESGAMDWLALSTANGLVGNSFGAAAIECALGGIRIRFDTPAPFAIAGAAVRATLSGKSIATESAIEAKAGDELDVQEILSGRFYYISVKGGLDVPLLMESRSTYLAGAFGGLKGRRLEVGDTLAVTATAETTRRTLRRPGRIDRQRNEVRVLRGAQSALFPMAVWRTFVESSFQVTTASDRIGYRLTGPRLNHHIGELLSEGACPGAVQVPPDGLPIVLMADCPTLGGYPKIAVVITADLPFVAQRAPGETLSFAEVTLEQAGAALMALTEPEVY